MRKLLYFFSIAIALIACDSPEIGEPIAREKHTLIVYMIGDNSLSDYSTQNISQIQQGLAKTATTNNILLYVDNKTSNPQLFRFALSKGTVVSEVVKNYEEGNSASLTRMSEVMTDALSIDTADSYGLILWSHATGWLPPNFSYNGGEIVLQSFGKDNNDEMKIEDMATALPSDVFNYIIFDACLMGGVEVAYQLRNKADLILAATTQLPGAGLPYESIIPMLLGNNRDIAEVANACYEYYTNTLNRGVALSVVKTSELSTLADIARLINTSHSGEAFDTTAVQHFDDFYDDLHMYYDLTDIIKTRANADEITMFKSQMEKTVVFSKAAATCYGTQIQTYCGLSSYIIGLEPNLDAYYIGLDWYNDTY